MDLDTIKTFENEAKAVFDKALAGFKAAQSYQSVQALEGALPAAKALADRILSIVPIVGEVENVADALIAAYAFAQAFGIKPMDANEMASHEDWHTE